MKRLLLSLVILSVFTIPAFAQTCGPLAQVDPTLIDMTDRDPTMEPFPVRYVTEEVIDNCGYIQGTLIMVPGHEPEIGVYDLSESHFEEYEDGAGGYWVTGWVVRVAVTPANGLWVFEEGGNGLLYNQGQPYQGQSAVVRIDVDGNQLHYYLNGVLMFSSTHKGMKPLPQKDVHGYYYDEVAEKFIGIPEE